MKNTSDICLGVDTALGETSLAVWKDGAVVAQRHHAERDRQATMLRLWIEALLQEAEVTYTDLTKIAACIGPGGFTGIRIGLAMARGIGFAAQRPVVGYSSLHLMAFGALPQPQPFWVALPAGRSQVFVQEFDTHAVARNAPAMRAPEAVPAGVVCVSTKPEFAKAASALHNPARNAALMLEMLAAGHTPDAAEAPVPLYIRPADATPQQPFLESLKPHQAP